ncbi:UbiH/UbiF/VisC/COQ6 family ubiquinone biosynthesis hydroxylase [Caldichromatium japonicum]|uniref:UbiH/UbiF/VisC/COQ6 family ubiquinone biosynthesis hydroxylase n=1 Tax=Caldichromatium japonicum TaxID=2699430 RepID=A0A6G7VA39_9GAMM|nr:UbiH/UbiF/VisC/COQ6 family ubiquinone biosynthesis hydroxylase [Caldichromatium japonicum]QIK36881.1 UbiH/UbiF/VisC/COQ6 family ubiquinone biosynthesis hydroxylase [Caldichromatium japonicum]
MVEEQTFDIIIAGGGMVGAACALALIGQGLEIGVIEPRPPRTHWHADERDLRVSAINRASQRFLERLDVWETIRDLGVCPYREMRVWDALNGAEIHFDAQGLNEPDLGHIIENQIIQRALWESLSACEEIKLISPVSIIDLETEAQGIRLRLSDGCALRARLLIGADGRDSLIRSLSGIETQAWDYGQRAIIAHVQPTHWHRATAWQRFLPTGPLALLPLADGRCALVWSADEDYAAELMALDEARFNQALTDASESRLGALSLVSQRLAIPLRAHHARAYVRPGVALIGDAAHAIHPLAGQGVNLGFMDAAALAWAIQMGLQHGRDIAGLWTLRRYERARRGANLLMLQAMNLFKALFGNREPAIVQTRALGLGLAERLDPLKQLFMRQALGLDNEFA